MNRRGAALLTVILATLVLACMVKALVLLAQRGAFQGRQDLGRAQLASLVEAGVADAQSQLAQALSWSDGLTGRLPRVNGRYTVSFHTGGGPVPADRSVNNLLNKNGSVNGPRGANSVLPRTADLIVNAEADGQRKTVEVLIQKRFMAETPYALQASGKIHLKGDVRVDGVKDLGAIGPVGPIPVPAGIHSNLADPTATDVITYERGSQAGDRAVVTGKVSTVSPNAGAINLGDQAHYTVTEGLHRGQSKAPDPPLDIDTEITANRSHPAPAINPTGTTTLSNSKNFHEGDLTINGDLNLDNANLYISGNLTVNGAISGKGTVFVGGQTAFKGDTKVQANNDQGIALMSKGSVDLTGFDGTAYLKGLVGSSSNLSETMNYLAQMAVVAEDPVASGGGQTTRGPIRALMQALNGPRSFPSAGAQLDDPPPVTGVLTSLIEEVEARPESDRNKAFIVKKLKTINGFFDDYGGGTSGGGKQQAWVNGGLAPGALDEEIVLTVGGGVSDQVWWQICRTLKDMDLNRIGTSYFQGVIYTNGSIHAAHEVQVVGAIWARDNGSQQPEDGRRPGDIELENNVKLTLVQRYVTGEAGGESTVGIPTVMSWTER